MFKIFENLEDAINYCNEKTALLPEGNTTLLWDVPREMTDGNYAVYSEDSDAVDIENETFPHVPEL